MAFDLVGLPNHNFGNRNRIISSWHWRRVLCMVEMWLYSMVIVIVGHCISLLSNSMDPR